MVRRLHLPLRAIEGSSLVGPAFWCEYDQNEDDRHLRMKFLPLTARYGNLV